MQSYPKQRLSTDEKGKETANLEKRIKFSENPTAQKTLWGSVIALLCLAAIIVGIVAAGTSDDETLLEPDDPAVNGDVNGDGTGDGNGDGTPADPTPTPEKVTYIAPVAGTVVKNHSLTVPVFSETLEAWRIHTGIDISCDEGSPVFAAADGEVTRVYNDPMLGTTVELRHADGMITRYSNLSGEGLVSVGTEVEKGTQIAKVGDSSISELADESHLHFDMISGETKVDPLDYIDEESKKVSLGIETEEAA